MQATIDYDIYHPFNYILARPHARYRTLTVVKAIPGPQTGFTHVGHINVEIGDDATTGVQMLGTHFYAGAEVRHPKNVWVQDNTMVIGYEGGLGSGFYKRNDEMGSVAEKENYNPNFDQYGSPDDSFFVFAIPPDERVVTNPISLDGTFSWVDREAYPIEEVQAGYGLTHSTAVYYTRYWDFARQRWNRPLTVDMYNKYQTSERSIPNGLCFESLALQFEPHHREYRKVSQQTGHWKDLSVGHGRARVGKASFHTALGGRSLFDSTQSYAHV